MDDRNNGKININSNTDLEVDMNHWSCLSYISQWGEDIAFYCLYIVRPRLLTVIGTNNSFAKQCDYNAWCHVPIWWQLLQFQLLLLSESYAVAIFLGDMIAIFNFLPAFLLTLLVGSWQRRLQTVITWLSGCCDGCNYKDLSKPSLFSTAITSNGYRMGDHLIRTPCI